MYDKKNILKKIWTGEKYLIDWQSLKPNTYQPTKPMKEIELIICRDNIEGDIRYNVIDLIDSSFTGRGESFRNLRDAISYCKAHKVGYSRRKDMDINDN